MARFLPMPVFMRMNFWCAGGLLLGLVLSPRWTTAADAVKEAQKEAARAPSPQAPVKPTGVGETRQLVTEFSREREAYLAERTRLRKQWLKSSEKERQALRDQAQQENCDLTRAREETRERLRELRDQLPRHRDLIDDAREQTGGRSRRGE